MKQFHPFRKIIVANAGIFTPKSICPVATSSCLFLLIFSLTSFSCKKTQHGQTPPSAAEVAAAEPADSLPGQVDLPSGIPVVDAGRRLSPDSFPQAEIVPLKSIPKVITAHPNRRVAGPPKVVEIPAELTVITPGENGVPLPETKPVKGKIVTALQQKPVVVPPFRSKEDAFENIQYLENDLGRGSDQMEAICEDSRGFLWLGSSAGAIRYDGTSMMLYSEKEGMSANMIRAIVEDQKGRLWFATWGGGATCYDGTRFIHFTEKEGMSSNYLYSMIEDSKGNLWFGTYAGGVIRYDGSSLTIFTQKQGLSDQSVGPMMEDSKGNLWFGTVKGGTCRFDGKSFTHFTEKEGLCSKLVYSITEDRNGNIWFGTYKGASRFDGKRFTNFTEEQGLIGKFVKSIYEDQKGNIWIANSKGSSVVDAGVSRFDGQYFTNFTEKEGLGHNRIWKIYGDKKGTIWLATGKGITRIRPESFNHFSALNGLDFEQSVSTTLEDGKGNLWLGTWGSGLIRFDGENFAYFGSETGLKSTIINKILIEKDGTLWLDAGRRGASSFDGKIFKHYWVGFSDYLNLLLIDSDQNVWFSVVGGLIKKKGDNLTIFDKKEIFGEDLIDNMLEDSQGNLWFGSESGAIKYDGKAFVRFTEKEGLSSNSISDIFEDSQGKIWFGTGDAGLNVYDGNRFTHITEKDRLGNNAIYDITEDSSGNIWVGRYHGMSVLSPVKTWPVALKLKPEAPASLPSGDYFIVNYDTEDGLQGKNYMVTYLDQKNYLWLGNESGLTKLSMAAFGQNINPPVVYLEHLEIAQQFIDYRKLADTAYQHSIPFGKEVAHLANFVAPFCNHPEKLILPYELNHLTFHFSYPNLEVPHKIQYSYFIEGVDKDWSRPQPEPKAEYRNLSSGTLTIKVRAVRDGQIWSEPFSYTFTIQPPWYRHWLAYLIYILAGGSLLFAIRHYELNRQLARAEARRLAELDQVKNRLYTNITHEFRTPLTVINGMTERLQGQVDFAAREGLKLIKRNGLQLLNLVNQILDLAKLESGSLPVNLVQGDVFVFLKYLLESFRSMAGDKNISLQFKSSPQSFHMDFDPEKLRQIMSNLVQNAIKFTPAGGRVEVAATGAEDQLRIEVNDNGRGIPPEQLEKIFDRFHQVDDSDTRSGEGTGIGLTLTRELVKLLGGQISVESEVGVGSQFTVLLPVTRQAESVQSENLTVPEMPVLSGTAEPEPAVAPSSLIPHPSSLKNLPTLLIIEDNPDVVQYVSLVLKNDYQLLTASDGKSGLETALAEMPDLILSDVMMPEMDGFEVCRRLKNDLATSHIPVVLLTAKADFESRIEGLELGADAYLAKPFQEKELKIVLKKLLENQERLRQFYTSEAFFDNKETGTEPDVRLPARDREFFERFREVIEAHFDDPDFTAEELSQLMFVSYSTCRRKVKAMTGMAVNEYLRHIRLHRAAQWLLEDPDRSVASIAEAAGYSSHNYFDRDFKKMMGCSPSEYRKKKAEN
jgi:two-component system, sensor histidine kinase ChiS